jgi:hypothetical protein
VGIHHRLSAAALHHLRLYSVPRRGGGGRRNPWPLCHGVIGFFCWLLFILAVYALPFVAGLTAGLAAYHSGAGIPGAIIVAIIAGGVTLTIGQIAFATVRSPLIRAAIGLIYAVPAAIAGYNGTLGFAQMGIPSEAWRVTFAVIGAIAVGGTAWARMALFVPPEEGLGIAGSPAPHRLAGATRQG